MLSQQTSTLLYGKPLIKPSTIESELEKIRGAAATQDAQQEAERSGSAAPRARATLSNLILLNTNPPSASVDPAVDRLMNELCVSHPSRFFVVDCQLDEQAKEAATGIATAVSSRCFLADSGAHVCSEEVYISVSPKAVPLVSNLLISLLVPDVDVVVMIPGKIASGESERQLLHSCLKLADRVLYDSSAFESFVASAALLVGPSDEKTSPRQEGEHERKLCDINWKRSKRWRALIAESFDAEKFLDAGKSIRRIGLGCGAPLSDLQAGKVPADAVLLSAWVLASLDIQPKQVAVNESVTGITLSCEYLEGSIELDYRVSDSEKAVAADGSSLANVELIIDTADFTGRVAIERNFENGTAEISTGVTNKSGASTNSNNCDFSVRQSPFVLQAFDDLVLANLATRGDDTMFLRSLGLARQLAQSAQK